MTTPSCPHLMKNLFLILILSLPGWFPAGCNSSQQTADARDDNKAADTTFARVADEFLDGYLAWRPQLGTSLGLHQYDGKLTNFNKASLKGELARLNAKKNGNV